MATLKDDDSSWKAHGLKKKVADWENDPKPRNIKNKKKNTKKWCKGKVGREHDFQVVLIVTTNDKCFVNGERCGHWRHYETKCVNCGKLSYGVDPGRTTKQKELEKKWCKEGHLYDWVQYGDGLWSKDREIQTCLMCGKTKGKSRKKMDDG